jgi:hypothetical protein
MATGELIFGEEDATQGNFGLEATPFLRGPGRRRRKGGGKDGSLSTVESEEEEKDVQGEG